MSKKSSAALPPHPPAPCALDERLSPVVFPFGDSTVSLDVALRAWPDVLSEIVIELLAAAPAPYPDVAKALRQRVPYALSAATESLAARFVALRPFLTDKASKCTLPESYTPLHLDDVAHWLEPDSPCARTLEGYEYREGQVQMARAVASAFNASTHLLMEAGTGIGKSVAYLIPAILWALQNRVPVIVSTNTKNLQAQLFHKDIPTLRNVIPTAFRAALIKGRMNYVCLRKVVYLLEHRESELDSLDFLTLAQILVWLIHTPTGDLNEIDSLAPPASSLRHKLCSSGDECGGRACRCFSRCLLQHARNLSLGANIVVANHSLVFAELENTDSPTLPNHAHVIFDEAHNIEEAATQHFTKEITSLRLHFLLRRIWRGGPHQRHTGLLEDFRNLFADSALGLSPQLRARAFDHLTDGIVALDAVRKAAHAYLLALATLPHRSDIPLRFQFLGEKVPTFPVAGPVVAPLYDDVASALSSLHSIVKRLVALIAPPEDANVPPTVEEVLHDAKGVLKSLEDFSGDLVFVTQAADANFAYWLDTTRYNKETLATLYAAPIDIAPLLTETLFGVRKSVILSSATLSINGSFAFLSRRIGLNRLPPERLATCIARSPFDYATQCRAIVPLFLPDVTDASDGAPSYTAALATFLDALFDTTRGRALVLFTSYEMLRECAALIAPSLKQKGITLLVQGEGMPREKLTRHFRNDISSVLFGTDSFWEGVDVMGESLSCVVIARLPFDAVKEPIVSARAEHVERHGGSSFADYSLPNAIIKFRQGFGRLIRHREDRGVVIVADRRIHAKGYGLHFRRSLPCTLAQSHDSARLLADIKDFLKTGQDDLTTRRQDGDFTTRRQDDLTGTLRQDDKST